MPVCAYRVAGGSDCHQPGVDDLDNESVAVQYRECFFVKNDVLLLLTYILSLSNSRKESLLFDLFY